MENNDGIIKEGATRALKKHSMTIRGLGINVIEGHTTASGLP